MAGLSDPHFERAPDHVTPVKLDIDRVDAVLVGDEANGVLI